MNRNPDATCGGKINKLVSPDPVCKCPYYEQMEEADRDRGPDNKIRLNAPAWGYCKLLPHWERKNPHNWCGQHPEFEVKEAVGAPMYDLDANEQRARRIKEYVTGE